MVLLQPILLSCCLSSSLLLHQWIQIKVWQDVCRLPVPKDQKKNDVDVNKRNLVVVLINSSNQILFNGEPTDIKQLKDKVKKFIDNPYNDANKPEKVEEDVPFFGKVMTAKKIIISLQNDRGTEYQAYISVQNELAKAYNELRDDISRKKFGKLFADLDEDQQKAVQQIYPQKDF